MESLNHKGFTAIEIVAVLGIVALVSFGFLFISANNRTHENAQITSETVGTTPTTTPPAIPNERETPEIQTETVLSGLEHPWDIVMFADSAILFTERANKITLYENGELTEIAPPTDTHVKGEGGMLGLTLDPIYEENQYVYACFNSLDGNTVDIRVVRWKFDRATKTLSDRVDLITGIPAISSGRHSGCRVEFGPDDYLWVATGDSAQFGVAQNPQRLGGKILRIDREGNPAPGNLPAPFDPRVYSYGHRNLQGLAFFSNNQFAAPGVSIEHGPSIDDEVNPLLPGNFGWDPGPGYDESVPMTDIIKYPDAITAIWSSGSPTLATSGGAIIHGTQWKARHNAVAVAALKGKQILIIELDRDLRVTHQTRLFENEFGRIRTIRQGTDGSLYLLTDNGVDDKIIRLSPQS